MATEIRIRLCSLGDEDSLALVGQATFLETFAGHLGGRDIISHCSTAHSSERYSSWLGDPTYRIWLVETDPGSAPIGFMVVAPAQLPLPDVSVQDLEIKRIYVLSKFQGGGTGKVLVAEALQYSRTWNASRLLLGVYAGNDSAIGFYEHVGFRKLGTRKFNIGGHNYDDNIMGMSL